MSVYLHDIPLDEAIARLETLLDSAGLGGVLGEDVIPLDEAAVGRTLSRPVWARLSSPHYNAAAMDGFALRSAETAGASPVAPVELAIGAQACYVDTGDPLPDWADAVVPIEETEAVGGTAGDPRGPAAIRIRSGLTPWKHVRPMGEDLVASELVLPRGHVLRPADLGACAGSGARELHVARRPRVLVIPTGTELRAVGEPVGAGEIIEYNSIVLAAQLITWGAAPERRPIQADDFETLKRTAAEAAGAADLVLLLSGSSAGAEDFSSGVIESLGEVLVHGVAVRPGHPVIIGVIRVADGERRVPVIGVPGYPVSAALTGEIFIEPVIAKWLGRRPYTPHEIEVELARKTTSPLGDADYVRVVIGKVGERTLAVPISRGAGVISSLVRADGIVVIPAGTQGYSAGERVRARLYRTPDEIDRTILCTGSHDVALDLAAQYLAERGRRFASANAGSLGGLLALKRGEAHLAGTHLLDPETGVYNLAYVQKYMPGEAVHIIRFVDREQGLIVRPGDRRVRGLADLADPGIFFVNRQRGSGTRVLLDHELEKAGLAAESINGYGREEYTHLAVAAAVASGRADCGLGIPAAARAVGMDFIPLFTESYDFVIPDGVYNTERMAPFLALLTYSPFVKSVSGLPGYDVTRMGEVVALVDGIIKRENQG